MAKKLKKRQGKKNTSVNRIKLIFLQLHGVEFDKVYENDIQNHILTALKRKSNKELKKVLTHFTVFRKEMQA